MSNSHGGIEPVLIKRTLHLMNKMLNRFDFLSITSLVRSQFFFFPLSFLESSDVFKNYKYNQQRKI